MIVRIFNSSLDVVRGLQDKFPGVRVQVPIAITSFVDVYTPPKLVEAVSEWACHYGYSFEIHPEA